MQMRIAVISRSEVSRKIWKAEEGCPSGFRAGLENRRLLTGSVSSNLTPSVSFFLSFLIFVINYYF